MLPGLDNVFLFCFSREGIALLQDNVTLHFASFTRADLPPVQTFYQLKTFEMSDNYL